METQFRGEVVDGYGSAQDGHCCVSAHGYACGGAPPARVSVCVRAHDYDMHACCHWRVVIRRVGARFGSYYVSHLYSHRLQTQS